MSQQHSNAATAPSTAAPQAAASPLYERRSVVLTAKVLSALGNAIFAFGLVGLAASLIN